MFCGSFANGIRLTQVVISSIFQLSLVWNMCASKALILLFCSGKANSLSVWWSGGTQLFIYSLVKTAKGMEVIKTCQ